MQVATTAARLQVKGWSIARQMPALALLGFGLILLFGVGFSNFSVAHNSAHDTRHAAGFPCH